MNDHSIVFASGSIPTEKQFTVAEGLTVRDMKCTTNSVSILKENQVRVQLTAYKPQPFSPKSKTLTVITVPFLLG